MHWSYYLALLVYFSIKWLQVITIFSASNYYELGSNKGAYLKLVGPQLATHFVQYTSAISKTKRLTFRQRVGLVESSAIRELSAQILSSKKELEAEFKKLDPEDTGEYFKLPLLLLTATKFTTFPSYCFNADFMVKVIKQFITDRNFWSINSLVMPECHICVRKH